MNVSQTNNGSPKKAPTATVTGNGSEGIESEWSAQFDDTLFQINPRPQRGGLDYVA